MTEKSEAEGGYNDQDGWQKTRAGSDDIDGNKSRLTLPLREDQNYRCVYDITLFHVIANTRITLIFP